MSLYNMVKACSLGHPDYCTLKKTDYHFSVEREREKVDRNSWRETGGVILSDKVVNFLLEAIRKEEEEEGKQESAQCRDRQE